MTPPAETPVNIRLFFFFKPVALIRTLTLRKKRKFCSFWSKSGCSGKPTPTLAVTFPQERLPVKQRHKAGISAPPRCRNPPKKAPESVEDRPIKTKGVIFGGIRRLRRNARRQNRAKPTPYPNAVRLSRPRKNASGFGYSNGLKDRK